MYLKAQKIPFVGQLAIITVCFLFSMRGSAQTQEPFDGIISIPGIIQAENFDNGGEGISYHDADPTNRSGSNYRSGEGVDIGIRPGGGYAIGFTANDEWLEYTIDVAKTSVYDFEIVYSSGRDGALLGIEIDSTPLFSNHSLPRTTSWDVYISNYMQALPLEAGVHILKIRVDNSGFNLDKIIIVGQQEPFDEVVSLPGVIEAENYDLGGEGTAYHDNDPTNSGGAYRSNDVDIMGDAINGYVITETVAGEWLEYSVNVGSSDFYDLDIIYASNNEGLEASLGAELINLNWALFKNSKLLNTDSLIYFDTLTVSKIFLPQGSHILRLNIENGGAYIDRLICYEHNFDNDSVVSSPHPRIWVNKDDRSRILENISKYDWASSLFSQLKSNVDGKKNSHKNNPQTLLNSIPARGSNRSAHTDIITLGVEAGILYYLTEDEDYAQLAADILSDYTLDMGTKNNGDIGYTNDEFMDSRITWPRLALVYDFVHPYLIKPGTTVYDNNSKTTLPYNFEMARTTFKILANLVFDKGGLRSNHSVLEGNGALFPILCLEDEAERNAYKTKFWNGTSRQDAFTWSLNNFSQEEGMWPETVTYGKGPQELVLQMMEIVDRNWPGYNVFNNNMRILDGAFVYENFKYPNNISIMAYGDSRRQNTATEELYRNVLAISARKGFTGQMKKAFPIVKQIHDEAGGFNPKWVEQVLNYDMPLQLLWTVPIPDSVQATEIEMNTTAAVTHAGLVMQRNYFCDDEAINGLMCYTGGAHYVHSHLSGLDMELYGAGYVMGGVAADMPSPDDRSLDINRHYYRIYAGHNTVIVNGKSQGRGSGSWKGDGMLWQNTTVLQASEPKPLADPISESFSFSSQFLDDNVNNCDQQRMMSLVRTSPTTGYYIDLFRSKSLGANNFHDYVYHNIGDKIELFDDGASPLSLTPQADRYQSFVATYNGATVKFPGWHYFENVKTSNTETGMVKAKISLTSKNRYMHALMPNGVEREYSTTTAPPILEAEGGYNNKDARVLTIRQSGEAWEKPFIVVYEPSTNSSSTVSSVENIMDGSAIVGAKVISKVGASTITDYIIAQDNDQAIYNNDNLDLNFKGRFAIVRTEVEDDKTKVSMYIGEGDKLEFKGNEVLGDANNKAFYTYEIDSVYDTGIKMSQVSEIKIFPNPVKSALTIEVNDAKSASYAIFNMNGILIAQDQFYKKKVIDLSDRKSGLYLVQVKTSKGSFSKKIVVE